MLNKVDLVIFHAPCFDGSAGAWVVKKWCEQKGLPVPELYGCKPGMETYVFPEMKGKSVAMIDICFDRETVLDISRRCDEIVILDHHKTSQENMHGLPFALFDNSRSGCQLAWDYFFPGFPRPLLLDMIGDRDLWQWKIPGSKEVNTILFQNCCNLSTEKTIDTIDEITQGGTTKIAEMRTEGALLNKFQQKNIDSACYYAVKCTMYVPGNREFEVWASDCRTNRSEVGSQLARREDGRFGVIYSYDIKNDEWWISLRSIESKANVGEIAKRFDRGGGHVCAAGFTWKGHIRELLKPVNC